MTDGQSGPVATETGISTAEQDRAVSLLPYGKDYTDLDQWVDRNATVHEGLGPYQDRWTRRLRRRLRPCRQSWWS